MAVSAGHNDYRVLYRLKHSVKDSIFIITALDLDHAIRILRARISGDVVKLFVHETSAKEGTREVVAVESLNGVSLDTIFFGNGEEDNKKKVETPKPPVRIELVPILPTKAKPFAVKVTGKSTSGLRYVAYEV